MSSSLVAFTVLLLQGIDDPSPRVDAALDDVMGSKNLLG
jgi:hypothetical protein